MAGKREKTVNKIARAAAVLWLMLACLPAAGPARAAQPDIQASHALAMSGQPKYPAGFKHFDYVNPDAPKGGAVREADIGTFDSFNPFISKGVAASGLGLIYDSLTERSADEPFTQYGLVAEKIEVPKDRSWVIFYLNPKAAFNDGHPITAEDVVFTFNLLMTKGSPLYHKYYADVAKVEALGERKVKFTFKNARNPELALIIGELQVLPKHYWQNRDFTKTELDPPLGSGPYRIDSFKPGHFIVYRRADNYWAKDLPVNRGRYNFDQIRYDYYRDNVVALEAFKAGEYDFRLENTAKSWANDYTSPAFERGWIVKEEIRNQNPQGMQGFFYNTRRPVFADRRVREALGYAFDFEWSNRNLFYGQYTRTASFFANSELASGGPPSAEELKVLEPFRAQLPAEVFTKAYKPPTTDGSGNIRTNLLKADELLRESGWVVKNRQRVNEKTGQPFAFEILLVNPEFERIVLPFKQNLARLGIEAQVRTVDVTQYTNRMRTFDFDMTVGVAPESLSPGNEQRNFWDSKSADIPGSRNLAGIKSPAIDALVELVISAPDRQSLITRTRALDRALLWGFYVIPQWHLSYWRIAYWNKFSRPATPPKYALGFDDTWWVDAAKEKKLITEKGGMKRD